MSRAPATGAQQGEGGVGTRASRGAGRGLGSRTLNLNPRRGVGRTPNHRAAVLAGWRALGSRCEGVGRL